METVSRRGPARVRNEAVLLYDMNADDLFDSQGYVVIDSSLGLIGPAAPPSVHQDSRKH